VRVKRDSGRPWVAGSSHAIDLTSATCSGGKTARATRARSVRQSAKAILEEPPAPLPDNPSRGIQPTGDVGVVKPLGRIEHDPRALDLAPWPLLSPSDALKLGPLLAAELDQVTGQACHHHKIQRPRPNSFKNSNANLRTGLLAPFLKVPAAEE
jgi:hypothetical protein